MSLALPWGMRYAILIFVVGSGLAGGLDGIDDLDVSGASANVVGDGFPDFIAGRMVVLQEERMGCHDHARNAEAALHCALVQEGLLKRMKTAVFAVEAFNRQDFLACDLFEFSTAGTHGFAVDEDDAGAANADMAAIFCSRQIQIFAKKLEKLVIFTGVIDDMFFSVDRNFHL